MNKYNDFLNIVQKDFNISCENLPPSLEFSREESFQILSENNDEIKPFAIISLKSIENSREAGILLSHLINHDGRIREAVSFILAEIPDTARFFINKEAENILTLAILDINPNVVRNIILFIQKNEDLKAALTPFIIKKTEEVLSKLAKHVKKASPHAQNREKSNKNHAKNRLTFNLYWLLSVIAILDVNKIQNLEDILTKTAHFLDYTIREKTAVILSKTECPPDELLRELKNDENMYVKNQLL